MDDSTVAGRLYRLAFLLDGDHFLLLIVDVDQALVLLLLALLPLPFTAIVHETDINIIQATNRW